MPTGNKIIYDLLYLESKISYSLQIYYFMAIYLLN